MSVTSRLVPPPPNPSLGEKVLSGLVVLAGLAVVVGVVWVLRFLVAPLVLAFLISYGLTPFVNLVENRGVPRTVAVVIAFGVVVGGLVFLPRLWRLVFGG